MGGPRCVWKLQKCSKRGLSCCGCRFQMLTLEVESQGPDGVSALARSPQLCPGRQGILPWSRRIALGAE